MTPTRPRTLWPALALLLAVLLAGCQSAPWAGFPIDPQPNLRWPTPPEPARVAFVMQIQRHQDLFTEAGGWRTVQRIFAGEVDSGMTRPYALALHPAGGLLVTDPGRACVHFYCWGQRRYLRLGAAESGELRSPVGVAALPDGRILVSDSQLGAVIEFGADGKRIGIFGSGEKLQRPAGIAVNPARQEVYVAEVAAHQIAVFNFSGALLRRIGSPGGGDGQFNFPTHLTLMPDGSLAVSDTLNFRVQRLSPEGAALGSFGSLGDRPGYFSKLKGIAATGADQMVVIEGLFDAMQFYTTAGALQLSIGSAGSGPAQFWLPAGVCYDPIERLIFVADSYNGRVQVFRLLPGGQP